MNRQRPTEPSEQDDPSMPNDDNETVQDAEPVSGEPSGERPRTQTLVRLKKNIAFVEDGGRTLDTRIVSPKFYNNFDYALLRGAGAESRFVIGVTSANPGDGKTVVASNLAVSLALSQERNTVLVDLNIARPKLHSVFGTPLSPGLLEALNGVTIAVNETRIKNLSVLTAGDLAANPANDILMHRKDGGADDIDDSGIGLFLEQLAEFRNVVYSLTEAFDFVVVDLPSMRDVSVPPLFLSQLDGIIIVVTAGVSKQEDIDAVVAQLEKHQILGFVLNRAS